MNFATLQGLTIPEGVVTQIADASGRVLWSASKPVILQVEKITDDTYAGETTYTGEQFLLLDIYPKKSNSKVNVTYGGLTKTIQFNGTNARQVFFGTFNGVSDSVTTPASGELTIDGDYSHFSPGTYIAYGKLANATLYCGCITKVIDWGNIRKNIPNNAFRSCTNLSLTSLPSGLTSIGESAFYGCTSLALTSLPSGITSIGSSAFNGCTNLALTSLPSGITSIGSYTFNGCTSLALTSLPSGITSIGISAFYVCTNLALTSLPSGITSIGISAFYGCAGISIGEIPHGVTIIGQSAFSMVDSKNHNMPNSIVLPSSITSIGEMAFYGYLSDSATKYSTYLDIVTVLATTPPTISGQPFADPSVGYGPDSIIVPKGCGAAYKEAEGWSKYAYCIVEAS